jgi:hypothetical protein
MPFFDTGLVPDFTPQQILLYQQLLRQKGELTRQIQALINAVPKVPRPTWGPCTRCGHTWQGYYPRKKPVFCTNCQSRYWDKPRAVERVLSKDAEGHYVKYGDPSAVSTIRYPKGLTPPPGVDLIEEVTTNVETETATIPVTEEPSSDSVGHKSVLDEAASPAQDEQPPESKCCSRPTIIDGICINCGDGLIPRRNDAYQR